MDQSVELFIAEQVRLAEKGATPRSVISRVKEVVLRFAAFTVPMYALMEGLSAAPRNAEHSFKLIYYGPALAVLGLASAFLLRRRAFRHSPFALAAWTFVFLAAVAIPAGALDQLSRNDR
jgi:tellurite resistance protein TehA-like permease